MNLNASCVCGRPSPQSDIPVVGEGYCFSWGNLNTGLCNFGLGVLVLEEKDGAVERDLRGRSPWDV